MDPGAFHWGRISMDVMNPSMQRFQNEYSHSGQKATCNEYYDEGSAAEKLYGVGTVPTWPWSIEQARGRRILDQDDRPHVPERNVATWGVSDLLLHERGVKDTDD